MTLVNARTDGSSRSFDDVDELRTWLLMIHQAALGEQPLLIDLEHASGATLSVGLGAPRSVLTFQATADPPYLVSQGPGLTTEAAGETFLRDGEPVEFESNESIAVELAVAAATDFMASGRLPMSIAWQEV